MTMRLRKGKKLSKKKGCRESNHFFEEHLVFILTIVITYVVGISLALIAFFFRENWKSVSNFDAIRNFLEAIIPTTITYVLVAVLENVIQIIKQKKERYVLNLITLVSVFLYLLSYTFYQMFWNTWFMIIVEMILTVLLLIANVYSYKEIYVSNSRNHNIVPT